MHNCTLIYKKNKNHLKMYQKNKKENSQHLQ